jgi:hypothetical protein
LYPHIGKAGTPYAKSVKSTRIQAAVQPDPGRLFDGASSLYILLIIALVARTEYKPHPNKINSLFYYMVVIIIHGISSL